MLLECSRGKTVAKGVRLIVLPGSQLIFREAIKEGIIEILLDAGAVIRSPLVRAVPRGSPGHPGRG